MTDDQTVEQMRVMRRTRSLIGDRGIRADPFQLHSRRHADSALAELRAQQAGRLAELRDCGGPSCRS